MVATTTIEDGGGRSSGEVVVVVVDAATVLESVFAGKREDLEEHLDDCKADADDCDLFRFFLPVVKGSN